jgi:hypothetical protein
VGVIVERVRGPHPFSRGRDMPDPNIAIVLFIMVVVICFIYGPIWSDKFFKDDYWEEDWNDKG